ncbi:vacuolar iron transporter (VIT) family protein [Striga asiatica]|uniref:Vacuolar iron transporter n=1 Tax=Striga asiatica TaxID=4170 RepID=A0A5A7QFM8_STRAF|nr:vacuolar iron transporter (VIT) family protein [Striga asiatica]
METIKLTTFTDGYKVAPKNDDVDVESQEDSTDYSGRAQWLRAAVLGANDGLLSTASLMMGVGAVRQDAKTMILTGAAGLVAGACSMAIGEFVSVYSQYDIEVAQIQRDLKRAGGEPAPEEAKLPNPLEAAAASASAFALGAAVPLLVAAFAKSLISWISQNSGEARNW